MGMATTMATDGIRGRIGGLAPVTCLSNCDSNAMQVPPTGPAGIRIRGHRVTNVDCSASRALCDKYLLTATAREA
ncbi:uncharacterized protein Dana_GF26604 [Drosophila ananassae]|uniref:Uncharacterized protein n=1 Tax=Drosophila ananassae TaxID=7217 RepID=A0A0P8XSV9_DROAN|nr:uncharacterized protein LOC26514013 [Drosophila ananassae]KPU77816.1 uncharacterized protein Dana_GF26604 [Drosophila ananassae]